MRSAWVDVLPGAGGRGEGQDQQERASPRFHLVTEVDQVEVALAGCVTWIGRTVVLSGFRGHGAVEHDVVGAADHGWDTSRLRSQVASRSCRVLGWVTASSRVVSPA